jgi:hypothetical protein
LYKKDNNCVNTTDAYYVTQCNYIPGQCHQFYSDRTAIYKFDTNRIKPDIMRQDLD